MVNFELDRNAMLSEEQKKELETARKKTTVYDEDSPELDASMEKAFQEARKRKPLRGRPLTVYVSPKTLQKAEEMGENYEIVLGRLLDKAVEEYKAM